MPKYLVTYHGSTPPPDPETMARAREAFMQWAHKTGPALVEAGAPVAATRTVSSSGSSDGGATDPFNGWSVVDAPDMETVVELLADHPFIGRGGVLQVSEPMAP